MSIAFKGIPLVLPDGSKVDGGDHLKGKVVALLFSAGWCPPCRQFTPKLKKFYEKLESTKKIEIVWVSRDRAEEDLVEYYKDHHGKWAYIPFGDPAIALFLEKYKVKTMPCLRVIKSDGSVAVEDARNDVVKKGTDAEALLTEWGTLSNN